MLKKIKNKSSLELFKGELKGISGEYQFDIFLKQYEFYPRYKSAVQDYLDWNRIGVRHEKTYGIKAQGETESTLISISMQFFLADSIFFEDAEAQRDNKYSHIIRSGPESKLMFLLGLLKDKESVVKGSYFSRGSLIRCSDDGDVFYLVSLKTPLDAVYYPVSGRVILDPEGGVSKGEVLYLLKRFINFYVKQHQMFTEFCGGTTVVKNIAQVARVDRPYHVFADEMSGNFYLNKNFADVNIPLYFTAEASFFESEKTLDDDELQLYGLKTIFFCYQRRLDFFSEGGEDFLRRLQRKALSIYGVEGLPLTACFDGRTVVWITISGGEKPRLKNELEVINELIKFMSGRFLKPFFIFDGFTATEFDGAKGAEFIDYHHGVVRELIAKNAIGGDSLSLVGKRVYAKVFYSQFADYVFSSGTPLIWSSNFVRSGGGVIVHGSKEMLRIVHTFTREKNICLLDSAKDWEDETDGLRFDRVSYSLSVGRTLSAINKFIEGV